MLLGRELRYSNRMINRFVKVDKSPLVQNLLEIDGDYDDNEGEDGEGFKMIGDIGGS
jgi:hypothetical protein